MSDKTDTAVKPSRLQAQISFGLFAPHDVFSAVVVIAAMAYAAVSWFVYGELARALACAVLSLFTLQVWTVLLVYRVAVFVLDLHSDVALMPESAARVAVAYLSGKMSAAARATET